MKGHVAVNGTGPCQSSGSRMDSAIPGCNMARTEPASRAVIDHSRYNRTMLPSAAHRRMPAIPAKPETVP